MIHTIETFEPTAIQQAYLEQKLQEVSRSFALVVPFLEVPLRHYLATAYLLCRVVDNIEDSGQPAAWNIERFAEFSRLVHEPYHASAILSGWERAAWPALTEKERRMMGVAEGYTLWQIYAEMPQAIQATIRHWMGIMAEGMKQLSDSAQPPSLIVRGDIETLETESDYNRYCYYVAGTVGHLVTELVIRQYQFPDEIAQELRARAETCGRALQKTNIVKDFAEDLPRGISYLPDEWLSKADYAPLALRGAELEWQAMVLADVLDELREATDYVLALPYSAPGYRRAALLCLLPAYQTILCAAQNQATLFTPAHRVKISRLTMAQCLADSQAMLFDNKAIQEYSRRLEAEVHHQFDLDGTMPERQF